jgi:DNA-binding transcriptional LysR family regulator
MSEVLKVTGGWDSSNVLVDLNNAQAIEALIAGRVDVVVVPELDIGSVERLLGAADIRLMNVAQAEAIAKTVPGLRHVVLWRGLIDLRA